MKKMTKYFLIFHTGMLLVTGLGMWFILKFFFPEMLLKSYPLIPIFFYLLGLVFIYVFNHNSLDKPEKIVNTYMLMRMIKIFVSAMLLFIYWIVDKDHIRNFAIIFVISIHPLVFIVESRHMMDSRLPQKENTKGK